MQDSGIKKCFSASKKWFEQQSLISNYEANVFYFKAHVQSLTVHCLQLIGSCKFILKEGICYQELKYTKLRTLFVKQKPEISILNDQEKLSENLLWLPDCILTTIFWLILEKQQYLPLEFGSYVSSFKNKIANIIPDDPERMKIASRFKACMDIQGFEYEIFTDYESAIEWLSQTEDIGQTTT